MQSPGLYSHQERGVFPYEVSETLTLRSCGTIDHVRNIKMPVLAVEPGC